MSNLHKKPTAEELEANAQKALLEAEALKEKKPEPKKEEPKKDPEPTPDPEPKKDPEPTPEPKKDPEPTPTPDPTPEPEDDEELKKQLAEKDKKLKASAREAQILYARNKQVNEAIEQASSLPDPTEDEMKAEYADWDVMSDFEKKMATESLSSKRRINAITNASKGFKDLEEWTKKVDTFVDDPTTLTDNPALEGRVDDFKEFALKPTRRGVDFEILMSSFLYQIDSGKVPRPKKTQMFPIGTGGQQPPAPKSDKITVEQARSLRETNYPEYKRLLLAEKIQQDDF